MEKTREEIERALLSAVQQAREEYEKAKAAHAAANGLTSDLDPGNPAGQLSLHQNGQATAGMRSALFLYREALRRFTDFVVSGRLPEDK